MDDLSRQLAAAREDLAPAWNVERAARLYAGTQQRGRLRTVQRAALGSALVLSVAIALAMGIGPDAWSEPQGAASASSATSEPRDGTHGHMVRLADGSHAELVGARSDLELVHNTKQRVALRLQAGRAHFEVRHDPARSFVVEAGAYRVEVIGTSFDVEREPQATTVSVARGKVRVYGPHGAVDIAAGQSRRFSPPPALPLPTDTEANEANGVQPAELQPEPAEAAAEDTEAPLTALNQPEQARVRPKAKRFGAQPGAQPGWRSLTQSGQYEAAFAAMQQSSDVEDDPAALMDAADAARLSGHAQNAVQYLERVVRDHARSPVAPLAAFTLGRVYLDKLGQPDKAAAAFQRARRLSPAGSLAQDALAREVEALSKGGNDHDAYLKAREYLRIYPNGRRLRSVQLYGGVE